MPKKSSELSIQVSPKNAGIKLAEEVKKMESVEDLGTSIYQTNQQFYLVIQSLLVQKFNFTEDALKGLHTEVTKALESLASFEDRGLVPLSYHDVGILTDLVLNKFTDMKVKRIGFDVPNAIETKRIKRGK